MSQGLAKVHLSRRKRSGVLPEPPHPQPAAPGPQARERGGKDERQERGHGCLVDRDSHRRQVHLPLPVWQTGPRGSGRRPRAFNRGGNANHAPSAAPYFQPQQQENRPFGSETGKNGFENRVGKTRSVQAQISNQWTWPGHSLAEWEADSAALDRTTEGSLAGTATGAHARAEAARGDLASGSTRSTPKPSPSQASCACAPSASPT